MPEGARQRARIFVRDGRVAPARSHLGVRQIHHVCKPDVRAAVGRAGASKRGTGHEWVVKHNLDTVGTHSNNSATRCERNRAKVEHIDYTVTQRKRLLRNAEHCIFRPQKCIARQPGEHTALEALA